MDARWDDLKAVWHLVREGTLAGAAANLGVAYTTVARRVARAEADLQVILFDRLADGYVATEAGKDVAGYVARMADQQTALMRHLSGQDQTLTGRLTITAPQLLISTCLCEVLDAFLNAHPDVTLDVRATNDLLDLTRREADLAIRISHTPGDSLMGLRLTEQFQGSFTSVGWAQKLEETPETRIDWIMHNSASGPPKASLITHPNARVKLMFDDMIPILGAVQAGMGVARLPLFLGRRTPGLVPVPLMPPQRYQPIWVVAHRDVWKAAKVRAFRHHLQNYFRQNADLFV